MVKSRLYICRMAISTATLQDIPALEKLVNSGYRGEASRKGWTTEADLLQGEVRTDVASLEAMLADDTAVILKHTGAAGDVSGCVYLQKQQRGLYLGMLTVSPELQGGGLGKKLLAAADEYAMQHLCPAIFMSVISVRSELIAWYQRHGYHKTGETKPFPDDDRYGKPTQPLEFIIIEKKIDCLV
jgi:ribosomal protein S18 acetylase RimI-like enzyme